MSTAPLPPGWEAKYDANSARYYFVNHYTKQTTWVDPRGAVQSYPQQQPVRQPQQQHHYPQQAAVNLQPSPQPPRQQPQRQQPAAQPQVNIPMVNISSTQRQPSPVATSSFGGSGGTGSASTSSARTSSARTASPNVAIASDNSEMVSEAEKQQLCKALKDTIDLVGVSDELILMTLDGALYDKNMAISMFESMGFRKKGAAAPSSSLSTVDRWEVGSSQPRKEKKKTVVKKVEPKKPAPKTTFAMTTKKTVVKKTTTTAKSPASTVSSSTVRSQPIPSLPTSSMDMTGDQLNSRFTQVGGDIFKSFTPQQESDLLSKMTKAADSSIQNMFASKTASSIANLASTKTATSSGTKFSLQDKLKAGGPNSELVRGVDRSLLRSAHVKSKGADSKLSVGSKSSLAKGPTVRAVGSRGTSKGANKSLCAGRNLTLAKGPQRVS